MDLLSFLKNKLRGPRTTKDTGWSWLVCFSSFILVFCSAGFHASFGLIFSSLIKEFGSSKGKTAVVGSLMISLTYLLTPLASFYAERWGLRSTALVGVGTVSFSLALTSFASSIEAMYASFGILTGLGASFMYMPTFVVLQYYFTTKVSLATGIAATGLPFQTIIVTPLFSYMIEHYGWRHLLRLLSFSVAILGMCAGLIYVPTVEENQEIERLRSTSSQGPRLEKYVSLLKFPSFAIFMISSGICGFGVNIINVHQVQYALELGIPWREASMLPIYMGMGSAIGRILCGQLFQKNSFNTLRLFQMILVMAGMTSVLTPLGKTYVSFVLLSFLYMMFDGGAFGVHSVPTAYVTGKNRFMQGWVLTVFVEAVTMIFGSPMAGLVVDYTQRYEDIYYIAGIPLMLGSALMTSIHYLPLLTDARPNSIDYFADTTGSNNNVRLLLRHESGYVYQKITVL